jgi:hypothetical protein
MFLDNAPPASLRSRRTAIFRTRSQASGQNSRTAARYGKPLAGAVLSSFALRR